ncbi:hypothetical protein NSTC745_01242 [Nostoc sp. DSM 114161]|jgi:WD40 repeat protein|uniref:WD40 domain-containing protein n=1 Tax=Nostoc sp. DSM 114161 TaxID=3440143 RepID=UPI0040460728
MIKFYIGLPAFLIGAAIVVVQPQIAVGLTATEISAIATEITVRIDGANTGTGIIIEHQGNTYKVLTNAHVLHKKGSYTLQTNDGQRYAIDYSQVRKLQGVDLAIVQFTSNSNYRVAEQGNSNEITAGKTVYVAGWADPGPQISERSFQFLAGLVSSRLPNAKDGYTFSYAVNALPGMSGGPILDEQGKVVGINGRAEVNQITGTANLVLGIPINTYIRLASAQPAKPPQSNSSQTPKPASAGSNSTTSNFDVSKVVSSVAISPDGKTLASGGNDKTIKIWNISTGEIIHTLSGHSRPVESVAISPDGKTLASGSGDKTIKIWNIFTGKAIRTLSGHSNSIVSVAISPDGKTLASGSDDKTIKIWDLSTGKVIRTLSGHSKSVESVAISPDGKTLASSSNVGSYGTIRIWDLSTGELIRTLSGNTVVVNSVAFSPDGKTLASGGFGETIEISNISTGKLIRTLSGNTVVVNSVAFSPDGKTLASGSLDETIRIWDLSTGELIRTLSGHSDSVNSVVISPDGKTLASGSKDGTIKIWNLSTGELIRTLLHNTSSKAIK